MDERELIRSAIAHINEAKSEIEFFSARNISPGSKQALDEAYRSLNNCIRHCQAIFGPATDEAKEAMKLNQSGNMLRFKLTCLYAAQFTGRLAWRKSLQCNS